MTPSTVRESQSRHPDLIAAMNNLAFVMLMQGKFAETESILREATTSSPKTSVQTTT